MDRDDPGFGKPVVRHEPVPRRVRYRNRGTYSAKSKTPEPGTGRHEIAVGTVNGVNQRASCQESRRRTVNESGLPVCVNDRYPATKHVTREPKRKYGVPPLPSPEADTGKPLRSPPRARRQTRHRALDTTGSQADAQVVDHPAATAEIETLDYVKNVHVLFFESGLHRKESGLQP